MSVSGSAAPEQEMIQHSQRPLPVTLIALFQFARSAFLIGTVLYLHYFPDTSLVSAADFKFLLYIAARESLPPPSLVPVILPLIAIYLAVTACGLWFLQKWARNLALITCAIKPFMWVRGCIYYGALGESLFATEWQRQTVLCTLLIDLFVFVYLLMTGDAFGEKD